MFRKIVTLTLCFCAATAFAELHEFNLPDGRSIKAEIVGYNARLGKVELKLGNGSRKKVSPAVFVQADQDYIQDWAALEGFRNSSAFKVECSKKKLESWKEGNDVEEYKYEKYVYEVMLENRTASTIDNMSVEYRIYYEQEVNDGNTKKVVDRELVKKGALDVDDIRTKEVLRLKTEPVVIHEYEYNISDYYREGGDPESTTGEIQGIWLRISVKTPGGQTAVRDIYEPSSLKGKHRW